MAFYFTSLLIHVRDTLKDLKIKLFLDNLISLKVYFNRFEESPLGLASEL